MCKVLVPPPTSLKMDIVGRRLEELVKKLDKFETKRSTHSFPALQRKIEDAIASSKKARDEWLEVEISGYDINGEFIESYEEAIFLASWATCWARFGVEELRKEIKSGLLSEFLVEAQKVLIESAAVWKQAQNFIKSIH